MNCNLRSFFSRHGYSAGVMATLGAAVLLGAGLPLYHLATRSPDVSLPHEEALWFAGAIVSGGVVGPVLLMSRLTRMPASGASLRYGFFHGGKWAPSKLPDLRAAANYVRIDWSHFVVGGEGPDVYAASRTLPHSICYLQNWRRNGASSMLVFVDTEFTDFIDCELISVGLVSEDGQHELYLEVADFDASKCNAFVQAAVCAHLGKDKNAQISRVELADQLRAWFAKLPNEVILATDSQHDCDLLLDALDGDMPLNFAGWVDLRPARQTEVFGRAEALYHSNSSDRPWHHALHDAKALRAGWIAALGSQKQADNS